MIQSNKSEFYNMEIKSFFDKIVDFTLKRLAELVGLLLVITSILVLLQLLQV